MYVRKEAVLSSQIEGTQSSLQDVLAAEASLTGPDTPPKDVDEVLNYVAAMNHGLGRLAALPVSVRLIQEIHEKLMKQDGPAHEVPRALGDLERFLHAADDIPLLIKIGLAHAQFETIHPFLDGNGRIGRLLITFLLCEREVLAKPVLYLSHFFKRNRQEYYDRLQSVRDDGSWEEWLAFFLGGVSVVSNEATETARRILLLREEHRHEITAHLGRAAGNGHKVLESLFDRPIVSVADVQQLIGGAYVTANNVVNKLTELRILEEVTGYARNRRFRYEPYVRLFTEA